MNDLNKQIADELGYRILTLQEPEPTQFGGLVLYRRVSPDGSSCGYQSLQALWDDMPQWAHSVDAALALPIESDAKWILEFEEGRPVAHLIRTYGPNCWMGVHDKEPTLAACMCKVWLLYRNHLREYALAD